jgi:hypothetical protein
MEGGEQQASIAELMDAACQDADREPDLQICLEIADLMNVSKAS